MYKLMLLRAMAAILDHFLDRLKAGARADLLSLARITFIKSRTARIFYDNGFMSVAAVANADPQELVPVLLQVCSYRPLPHNWRVLLTTAGPAEQSTTQIDSRGQIRGTAASQSSSNS
jgi:hypothetical protein